MDIGLILGYPTLLQLAANSFKSGREAQGLVWSGTVILATGMATLLTYGSVKRRSWAFWFSVGLLALGVLLAFRHDKPTGAPALITASLDALLLTACFVSAVVIGPWALRPLAPKDGAPQPKA